MIRSSRTTLYAFVIVASGSSAAGISQAQSVLPTAIFVKNVGGVSRSSNPSHLTDVGGIAFFSACTAATGCELWKSDGTSAGTVLVKDLVRGSTGASPSAFTEVNGTVFFVAADPVAGLELWKSDGTEAGTVRVKDIAPGPGDSRPDNLTNVNGTLFFTAKDDAAGEELWKSDGTEAGTVRVKDITSGPQNSGIALLTNVNGTLFFRASDPSAGLELWKSDGTEQGTQRVTDTVPGPESSFPTNFLSLNGTLFFVQADETSGRELWKSDGTEQGTVRVKDIAPGTGSSAPLDLTAVGGTMFFIATDLQTSRQLWKSDGTAAGTVIVKNMPSGPANPFPIDLISHAGAAFFIVQVSDAEFELWRSDGSEIGTGPVTGPFFVAGGLTSVNHTLFFTAIGNSGGIELFKSDGTAPGTTVVKDIRPGFISSNLNWLTNINGSLFFAADDGENGLELWKSDGTEPGTTMVVDVNPIRDLTAHAFLNVNGTTFFVANDRTFDAFWKTDGMAAGTVKVKNIEISGGPSATGSRTRKPGPRFVNFGGTLLFSATDGSSGHELWKSDGTEAGTVLVKDIWPGVQPFIAEPNNGAPTELTVLGNTVLFAADDGSGRELWRSDGTASGTTRVTTTAPNGNHTEGPENLTAFKGTLFFTSQDGNLWTSDGTTSRAFTITRLGARELTPSGDALYFADGFDLWKSDGTQAGTSLVKSIFIAGPPIGFPPRPSVFPPLGELTDVNGTLFFNYAGRLWKSDGTASGTVIIKDFGTFAFTGLTNVNGTLFFVAADAGGGRELWKSDGTEAGTVRVKDIASGAQDSTPESLTSIGGKLFFSATDGVHGRELWVSDGTNAGTFMVRDTWPGPIGSSPENLGPSGDVLYFTAADPVRGRQLWKATLGTGPTSTDTDGDGLSNVWETNFGFNPTSAAGDDGPNGDPDLDGFTNLEEYLDGTHPRLAATLAVDRRTLQFGAVGSVNAFLTQTPAQTVVLTQQGSGVLSWSVVADQPWLQVSPATGSGPAAISIGVRAAAGLSPSGGTASIRFLLAGSDRPFHQITVTLQLHPAGGSTAPFGIVDTPTENNTGVTGAVPFTGWALDDVEVARVMICRAAFGPEVAPVDPNCGGAAQMFIGFAVFIDGARPDVQAAYPSAPLNTRGGWGFMVLTNMLPNQGNGTYLFYLHAQDGDGHTTLLGSRTMTCANASATKPFGAIDTPTQGGTASGTDFVNFGWALTPQPKSIPFDGSTMTVMVDGQARGTVDYNHERPDIEALFPGFQNTTGANGAVGFRVIDTTTLTNGLHTISWTVIDNQGAIEGIGSRFFTVSNGAVAPVTAAVEGVASSRVRVTADVIAAAPRDDRPVLGRRGWDLAGPWRWYGVGRAGRAVIRGEEIDRLELALEAPAGARYTGHLRVGDEVARLPIGSQLDATTGQFTWAPGVGFVGTYDLVFVRWEGTRAVARHEVRVILAPKGSGHVGVQVAIDTPRSQQDVGQPFGLAGWAADLDAATGTGIDTLHVWAYPSTGGAPVFLGTPTLGGIRPDVAAVHGESFREAGFALTLQGLIPGTYDLAVFPWSNVTGAFAPPSIVHVTIR